MSFDMQPATVGASSTRLGRLPTGTVLEVDGGHAPSVKHLRAGSLVPFRITVECSISRAMHTEKITELLEATCSSSACVIDFFEARDRLKPGLDEGGQPLRIKENSQELAPHRLPAIKRADRLEESVYWVLSAAVLVCFLLEIIGR
jgi:hypothetical protein